MHQERALTGGNASGSVVKVGSTVRKAWTRATPSVHAYMASVREAGVDLPEPMGQDERGRQVIEFVPGRLAIGSPPLTRAELHRVGSMVRAIHDASADFVPAADARWDTAIPAPGAELVCHNDLAPWNLIIGERWVFIDWDAAAPSTRLWDLAYAAQAFTLSNVDNPPERAARDLGAFVDGYDAGASLRAALPAAIEQRAEAMLELLRSADAEGREPWATMFTDGHGAHWTSAVDYVRAHQGLWRAALVDGSAHSQK
ncbi:phosphotransferase [Microbacterium sp. H1-D42]|uniref:phosphotransferase n=1 Tax=Microbacterium sp. H1-D42 TaxID=2925844 RepID=UPI001F52E53F|nr:phosphotransferase [Microbacterium sp. H1-D42]UNK70957.1 phosphotransferase [Microbacterium sp. H1-D42]